MNPSLPVVGTVAGPALSRWDESDALLYALAVGAGQDPLRELRLTTENSEGIEQAVLPTFAMVIKQRAAATRISFSKAAGARIVHAQQEIELHRPLPTSGSAELTSRVVAVHDQGSGALVEIETVAVEPGSGAPIFTTRGGMFVRGHGGFGGERAPRPQWSRGDRPADETLAAHIRPEQALLYRLCGDRNPLHSDPAVATRAGFDRPILHGLCTLGFATRLLIHAVCDGEPEQVRGLSGRFTKPVLPGQQLTVSLWRGTDEHLFRVTDAAGDTVIDYGRIQVATRQDIRPEARQPEPSIASAAGGER